jgi:hypothetical protein
MSVVRPFSTAYHVVSGEHKGKKCTIWDSFGNDALTEVIFSDEPNKVVVILKGTLSQLDVPGWEEKVYGDREYYDLLAYQAVHKGDGTNLLRMPNFAQPRALKVGDMLASGEFVTETGRRGYNGVILIRLDMSGWVELAPRLPIAIGCNGKLQLPAELHKGDKLATGCLVVKDSISHEINWTDIYLDREDCVIDVPSCIPLALE